MFQANDGVGCADPVLDSQTAFGGCLAALAVPGTVVRLGTKLTPIAPFDPAASALLLALLDSDTRLWLSPGAAAAAAAASLKFHTGCWLAAAPDEADLALVASIEELPPLEAFSAGWQEYPERSATVILQVPELAEAGVLPAGASWRLSGPGIRGDARLPVPCLDTGFVAQWQRNHERFPRGVDLYLVCGDRVCGLPRTTRIGA